jgi:N-acetylglutamate synthase-like GNAT family acetyltransferase
MIRRAVDDDAETLMRLINLAFCVEKFFIESDRISLAQVREYFDKGVFLIAEDNGEMTGCVYVELRGERGYLVCCRSIPRANVPAWAGG